MLTRSHYYYSSVSSSLMWLVVLAVAVLAVLVPFAVKEPQNCCCICCCAFAFQTSITTPSATTRKPITTTSSDRSIITSNSNNNNAKANHHHHHISYHQTTTTTTTTKLFGTHSHNINIINNNNRVVVSCFSSKKSTSLSASLQEQQQQEPWNGIFRERQTNDNKNRKKKNNNNKNIVVESSDYYDDDKQQMQIGKLVDQPIQKKNLNRPTPSSTSSSSSISNSNNNNNQIVSFVGGLVVLTFVIVFHELGHFLTSSKLFGLTPPEFNVGFGPKLISFVSMHNNEDTTTTYYNLRLVPLGGYVSIDRSQMSLLPYWAQIEILSAGVFFNLLLSWFIYTYQIWKGHGIAVPVYDSGIVVGGLVEPSESLSSSSSSRSSRSSKQQQQPPSPAKGLLGPGDIIIGVNGKSIQEQPTSSEMEVQRSIDLVLKEVQSTPSNGEPVIFTVLVDGPTTKGRTTTKIKNVHVVPTTRRRRSSDTGNAIGADADGNYNKNNFKSKPSVGVYLLPHFVGMDCLTSQNPWDASVLAASYVSNQAKETMIGILTYAKDKLTSLVLERHDRDETSSSSSSSSSSSPRYEVAGPVHVITRASDVVSSHDLDAILNYVAAISINLGMFNFVPIPPTDGFQIVLTTILHAMHAMQQQPHHP